MTYLVGIVISIHRCSVFQNFKTSISLALSVLLAPSKNKQGYGHGGHGRGAGLAHGRVGLGDELPGAEIQKKGFEHPNPIRVTVIRATSF